MTAVGMVPSLLHGATLTGLMGFSATTTGDLAGYPGGQQVWTTYGPGVTANAWVARNLPAGSFINGPTSTQAGVNIPLAAGTHTFYMFLSSVRPFERYGVNLYFNGQSGQPQISVHNTLLNRADDLVPMVAVTAPGSGVLQLDGLAFVASPGSGSFSDGLNIVNVQEFAWYAPGLLAGDRVGFYSTSPDGVNDFVARLVLNVEAVPEPSQATLVGLGVLALVLLRGRARPPADVKEAAA